MQLYMLSLKTCFKFYVLFIHSSIVQIMQLYMLSLKTCFKFYVLLIHSPIVPIISSCNKIKDQAIYEIFRDGVTVLKSGWVIYIYNKLLPHNDPCSDVSLM